MIKSELLISKIPNLQIYTIETPLIVQIFISMSFIGPKNRTIRGPPLLDDF